MIQIIKNGEDHRGTFRFTCTSCGCVYNATEDEGDVYVIYEGTTVYKSMALECPMTFCKTRNVSSQLFNEGGQL